MNIFKKYLKFILYFLFFLGCSHNNEVTKGNIPVKINYLPFAIDTYVPVTTSNIETKQSKLIYLTQKEIENIYEVFKKVSPIPTFKNKNVRLRIAIPDREVIYIESSGEVLDGQNIKKIDNVGLKTLEDILNVDLKSNLGLY